MIGRSMWASAIRAVAQNIGLQVIGDVIVDGHSDGFRCRCRFPDDAPFVPGARCRIVIVPWKDFELESARGHESEAVIDHINACFDVVVTERKAQEAERKRQEAAVREQWSPYPQGAP